MAQGCLYHLIAMMSASLSIAVARSAQLRQERCVLNPLQKLVRKKVRQRQSALYSLAMRPVAIMTTAKEHEDYYVRSFAACP